MSKTEILRQSAAALNETRLERLASQIEAVRQAKHQSAEDLAAMLESLAQAMAALTDETRQILVTISDQAESRSTKAAEQIERTTQAWIQAAKSAEQAAMALTMAAQRMELRHYLLAAITGMISAGLMIGLWLLLAPPPVIQHRLDPKQTAEYLKPAVIEALKQSKGK